MIARVEPEYIYSMPVAVVYSGSVVQQRDLVAVASLKRKMKVAVDDAQTKEAFVVTTSTSVPQQQTHHRHRPEAEI